MLSIPKSNIADPFERQTECMLAVSSTDELLHHMVQSRLFSTTLAESLLKQRPKKERNELDDFVGHLLDTGHVTDYQMNRLLSGQSIGLVFGNYRILDRIGAGGMGVVYRAQHQFLQRIVALKVLPVQKEWDALYLGRFHGEMRALASLHHPNVILAFDGGMVPHPGEIGQNLYYLVMEHVAGITLEQLIHDRGPLPIPQACLYLSQALEGLRHSHEQGVIHRDIKPANLIVTDREVVKLIDFGVARLCNHRVTDVSAILGTVDYMPPEQGRDARLADCRSDIWSLGATLYFLLTGHRPFQGDRSALDELLARQHETPQPIKNFRPDIPFDLEMIVYQMMARDPNDRYATCTAVLNALQHFCLNKMPSTLAVSLDDLATTESEQSQTESTVKPKLLFVSPDTDFRFSYRCLFEDAHTEFLDARNASEAQEWLAEGPVDVVVLDPLAHEADDLLWLGLFQLVRMLHDDPQHEQTKVLLLTNEVLDAWVHRLAADEACLFDAVLSRDAAPPLVLQEAHLLQRLREIDKQSATGSLKIRNLEEQVELLEKNAEAKRVQAEHVILTSLRKTIEMRGTESSGHLLRMQHYVRVLAEAASLQTNFVRQIDPLFVRELERSVVLHDVGMMMLPEHIVKKPGPLTVEERVIMETHVQAGGDLLDSLVRQGESAQFLRMAAEIARYHHERYDGSGYPERLSYGKIPLSARIVAIADVYDALRSKLAYKPALAHSAAVRVLLESHAKGFDPYLLRAFQQCAESFAHVFDQHIDPLS